MCFRFKRGKVVRSFPIMIFHNRDRQESSPGGASRIWEGRRLVLALVGITPPVEPGEDKPSPLPYSGSSSFPISGVKSHYREGGASQKRFGLPINRETTKRVVVRKNP
jgi:hypothetical protein